jgi:pSer/pThr/pTyr-binding forkhead associated (FHA) protein
VSNKDENPNETIFSESVVGQRLSKVHKPGPMFLVFQGRSIPITSRITVGRDEDNSIVLDDPLASRHHAVIQKLKNEYFIEDLDSTNATFVNSKRVPLGKYVRLHPQDIILIGRTELTLKDLR